MPGGAGQLSSGGGQGRGAGAVTAEPSWVAERPQSRWPGARSGRPGGVAGREDVRTPARPVVPLSASSGPPWGCPSNRSSGHPASTRPVSRRPGHPGVRTDTLWCPRRCRRPVRALDPGLARCGGRPGRAQRVDMPPWSAGGVVACPHRSW